jgi:ribosomal protein S12 methylthiotransferase accessory factor
MQTKHNGKIFYRNYKDLSPEDTISGIRNILEENNIIIEEQSWRNALDSLYSCRLAIKGSMAGVNGKGVTGELALASGLAEVLERLQNHLI